jgi:hypothetical protein
MRRHEALLKREPLSLKGDELKRQNLKAYAEGGAMYELS